MTTHFITVEVNLQKNILKLHEEIEAELGKRGEPLRWSITEVDTKKQTVHIEGIITNSSN
ncbi:hypothetical protein [cyanobacterium endosymbiont of Epithemia turgida]|uniref:hypothetical protein n=1 Tax=cyanobacterium endosymbiont of Epithemia turgida TaxID=718217 RepID=UPI0004D13608|nr:hypothetical protein [cyanobacterium endosymbiont of Epithemia turgida]BAP16998.1 hypothetical protein ETSB_0103 [cyanobacterium endosymbiont of Epithemia turgida isolate EtSB Lake Yunoko]